MQNIRLFDVIRIALQDIVLGCCFIYIRGTIQKKMELIKNIDPEAEKWLLEKDPKTWSRAYFQIDRSCAAFENGISESYHNAIGELRSKPIITMLEEIRIYLMQRMVAMNKKAVNLNDTVCPSIRKYLTLLNNKQRYWEVIVSGYQEFEVRKYDQAFGVNLANKTVASRKFPLRLVNK